MNKLSVTIRTLTPLWTGGINIEMDRIHETGILGSLRWWYEAIVRGLGGSACDPTSDTGDNKRCPDKDGNYCDVCAVFGATRLRRAFRLEVAEDTTQPLWEPLDRMFNVRPPGRTRSWYLPPGRIGTLTLKFTGDPKVLSLMASFLLFLERWGNLGAKPQLGYGVFAIENRDEVMEWALGNSNGKPGWWTQVPGLNRVATQVQRLVSRFQIVPVSPGLKNEWRFNRWNRKWGDDREIFGAMRPKGDRIRSKVAVSWAYKIDDKNWEVRGWAWLKSLQWADRVWGILSDNSIWNTILPDGELYTQRLEIHQKVLTILNDSKNGGQ